ncbi:MULTISPECIES: hypothetical protein [unclassified Phenylobacterium]|uniref:hypothetical protein n=1 Tax=unclassified Phenylobacterium TaxID=2640670 RepID=UPI00083A3B0A|nr:MULTISPECIES: hypothetical protein [unclassified Phenylobacterium]
MTGDEPQGPYAFSGVPYDEGLRLAALRLQHDRLVEAQEEFLEDAARRWRRVQRLREFLDAVDERCAGCDVTAELQSWLAWAHRRCDRLDPLSPMAMAELRAYAAALRSPPDLPPQHPEEEIWRDMGLLDDLLVEEAVEP